MTFTITYRSQSGALQKEVVEAANRAEALEQAKSRGITPVSVKEGGALNAVKKAAKPAWIKGAVAGLVVVIAAVIALVCLMPAEKPAAPKAEKPKKAAGPKVEKPKQPPAKAAVAQVTNVVPVIEKPKKVAFKDMPTNGMTAAQLRRWEILNRPAPGYTNTPTRAEKAWYEIFKHRSENEIAGYITMEIGENLLGTPRYGPKFEKDFLESLKEPIEISDDDTDEEKELKRLMIATKEDLKKRVEAGESVGDILLETRKEAQDLAQYKIMLQDQLKNLAKDDTVSERDMDDFIWAANKMLNEKGIAPLKLGPVARRILMRRKQGEQKK